MKSVSLSKEGEATAAEPQGFGLSSEQLLQLIDTNVADLIAVIDSNRRRVWHNEAYCSTFGYSREELANSDSQIKLHPDDLPLVRDAFEVAVQTGVGQKLQYRMQAKDGSWIHLESSSQVVDLPEHGRSVILVARNITDRIRLEQALKKELSEAASYIRSLLPTPVDKPVLADWKFMPSNSLGGDAFFYDWMDDRYFRFGLLDVCGHGMGAALLSISAMNCLRAATLPDVDFKSPAQVLAATNRAYPMEEHGNRFFTMWYGVYDREDRSLTYGSAGHPGVILVEESGVLQTLEARGGTIGIMPDAEYAEERVTLDPRALVYLFSDGVYELRDTSGNEWPFEEFQALLKPQGDCGEEELERIMQSTREQTGVENFEDDYSMLRLVFR
ncbi:MAG: SpoIIE family protein phosphatase [Verrucomicrobiota bacterium]